VLAELPVARGDDHAHAAAAEHLRDLALASDHVADLERLQLPSFALAPPS